jgi:hypothetical protein
MVIFWLTNKAHRSNMPIPYFLVLIQELGIPVGEAIKNIKCYTTMGGHSVVKLPERIIIDENFFSGMGLYVGDGYTSQKLPRIIFINTNVNLVKFFIGWLQKYLKVSIKQLYATLYVSKKGKKEFIKLLQQKKIIFKIYKTAKPHHKTNCRIILSNAVYRYLLDSLIQLAQRSCLDNQRFAIGYLKGIMAAEGCINIPKARVPNLFIEMHIGRNTEHTEKLFRNLQIYYKKYPRPLGRTKLVVYRKDQLQRLKELNIFELHSEKQSKLNTLNL